MSASAPQRAAGAAGEPACALRVLVADDDHANRLLLRAILGYEGHDVLEAEDGAQAVALFERERPDLVLMDVLMPVMDGYEATRRIKRAAAESFVPVVFLTALTDEDALAACVAAGGDDFLTKPYKRTLLVAKIASMERIRELYRTVKAQHDAIARVHASHLRDQALAERVMTGAVMGQNVALDRVRTLMRPAATFNGDVLLTARHPCGDLNVLLGDFTGHGLAAAIGALPVAEVFRAMTARGFAPGEILRAINAKLHALLPTGMFMAGCLACLHPEKHTVSIWNGGMPPLLILDGVHGGVRARVASTHLPLGIRAELDDAALALTAFALQPQDQVFAYSDGLIEARLPSGELFGQERLEAVARTGVRPDDVFARLKESLDALCELEPPADDVTVVCIPADAVAPAAAPGGADGAAKATAPALGPWRWSLMLHGASLRAVDPLPLVLGQLEQIAGLTRHRQALYTILSELYNNALEHGILGLESVRKLDADGFLAYYSERTRRLAELGDGHIHIELAYEPRATGGRLVIRVEDSGAGFAHAQHAAPAPPDAAPATGLSGRGIALVRRLCASLRYDGNGSRVQAEYVW